MRWIASCAFSLIFHLKTIENGEKINGKRFKSGTGESPQSWEGIVFYCGRVKTHHLKTGKNEEFGKKGIFLSVNVFSTKVLTGDTIFTSPTGDRTAISMWSSEPRDGPAVCSAKAVPSFLSYHLRPWVLVRPRESNPRPCALQSSALPTELVLENTEALYDRFLGWKKGESIISFNKNVFKFGQAKKPRYENAQGVHHNIYSFGRN